MRKCKDCGKVKNSKDFYLNNKGYYSPYCKECHRKRTALWRKNNPQRFKELCAKAMAKKRTNPDYRKSQAEFYRKWYAKSGRKRAKNYSEVNKLWQKLNPEKCKASKLVEMALKTGKLKKSIYCSECGHKRKLVGHHDNYEFPLKVRWLCYSCHKNIHNNKNL